MESGLVPENACSFEVGAKNLFHNMELQVVIPATESKLR